MRTRAAVAALTLVGACATGDLTRAQEFPDVPGVSHNFYEVNGIRMHVAEAGEGPLVLLLHGFPELWYSWRHQLPALAAAGYHVAAPDMRGYGATEAPTNVDAYDIVDVCGDVIGLMDRMGERQAVVVGHDWGAAIAFQCLRLAPERYRAIITMSVPHASSGAPPGTSPLTAMRRRFGENFFYMLYFQSQEAETELNWRTGEVFQKWFASPGARREPPLVQDARADAGGLLDRIGAPLEPPAWITPEETGYFVRVFEQTGFQGGLNYYRNFDRSWEVLRRLEQRSFPLPALFIAGDQEALLNGRDAAALQAAMQWLTPNIEVRLLPEIGHWLQDEAPMETNALIIQFLDELPDEG